jgi:hypothetical protein
MTNKVKLIEVSSLILSYLDFLCVTSVYSVPLVVKGCGRLFTTEKQRTPRLHREILCLVTTPHILHLVYPLSIDENNVAARSIPS